MGGVYAAGERYRFTGAVYWDMCTMKPQCLISELVGIGDYGVLDPIAVDAYQCSFVFIERGFQNDPLRLPGRRDATILFV